MIVVLLLLLALTACGQAPSPTGSSGDTIRLAGVGDSITADVPPDNWSWLDYLPEHIETRNFGHPGATCPHVQRLMWPRAMDALEAGDTVVLMCRNRESEDPAVVYEMRADAEARGLRFIFATQPAWHTPNPYSRAFYDSLEGFVDVDNDRIWRDAEHYLRGELYTDGIHMTPEGAKILADSISSAL